MFVAIELAHDQVWMDHPAIRMAVQHVSKQAYAFAPKENLLAQVDAPPTIDATLEAAYQRAAFYIGQSTVVGDTTTDVIAYASDTVFVQAWNGVQDKLPRMLCAVFRDDPQQSWHQVTFSDWKLGSTMPADFFKPEHTETAQRIQFAPPPDMRAPQGVKEPLAKP